MAHLLGWKDILRPIRDGYRHLFPTPDTGPSPEERRRQRELDRLKGFAYFDTFDQLESWTEADSDPLQRANTPLLRATGATPTDDLTAHVLLIHDYSGNYHDYESVQPLGVDKELYSCEYLQFVDTFVYFSHKLVCVPPPTWTNTLHRNGVEALGTILIEPQTEGSERLLQHTTNELGDVQFPMVEKLVSIATHYGFDGWLVNIEKPFPREVSSADVLEAFLRHLKAELGSTKRLIWYDALTTSNKISYQNALTNSNFKFADACGGILTNYCWTEADALKSVQLGLYTNYLDEGKKIYFGVDVWAQNKSSFTHPRVTYPEYGGGGTNTGVAVAKMAEMGLSVGVFAPAWSFEHFPGHERDVERTIWEGTSLPEGIDCTCGDCASRHPANKELAILSTAKERVPGSENFFYTDFSRAFSTHDDNAKYLFGGSDTHSQLGGQSILPRPASLCIEGEHFTLSHHVAHKHNKHILAINLTQRQPTGETEIQTWLPLYKLDMPANGSLQLSIVLDSDADLRTPEMACMTIFIYFKTKEAIHYRSLPLSRHHPIELVDDIPASRVQELGVHLRGPLLSPLHGPVRLMAICEIAITPKSNLPLKQTFDITHVRVELRGQGECKHVRLCWDYEAVARHAKAGESVDTQMHMPWSGVTGPFAYFTVRGEGVVVGRAYALEFVLNKEFVDRWVEREVEIEVLGVGFDGRMVAERRVGLMF